MSCIISSPWVWVGLQNIMGYHFHDTNQMNCELVKRKSVLNRSDLGEVITRWIIKEIHSRWPGQTQAVNFQWASVTWQGSVGKPLVTSSQQDMGALVLEQQGAEFCQQPVSLQEDLEPSNTLISAWWDFEQRTQLTHIRFLTHGKCEITNLCWLIS